MSWDAVGAIGELLGSVGVLVTLIYLATQIRVNTASLEENRKYARAQMYQARADTVLRIMADYSDAMIPLLTDQGVDFERLGDLSPEQRGRLYSFARSLDVHSDNIVRQREIGILEVSDESLQAGESLTVLFELARRLNLKLRPTTIRHMQQHGIPVDQLSA